jgi:putative phosphoesterase
MPSENYHSLNGFAYPLTSAILTDTHVPDRNKQLPDKLVSALQAAKPDLIFHAGDISLSSVLDQLESIAPLKAVSGNRDFNIGRKLPLDLRLSIGGVKVALAHGQGSTWRYFTDKLKYLSTGYDFDRYRRYFIQDFPGADLIIFGHTHTPVDLSIAKRHYFNSGATYPCKSNDFKPRIGRIIFPGDGSFQTNFIFI